MALPSKQTVAKKIASNFLEKKSILLRTLWEPFLQISQPKCTRLMLELFNNYFNKLQETNIKISRNST